jgi:hypothetical protein
LQKQLALQLDIRKLIGDTHGAVMEIRSVRAQLSDLRKRIGSDRAAVEIAAAAAGVEKTMAPVEAELIEVLAKSSQDMCNYPTMLSSKVAWLDQVVDSADRAPTQQSYELYREFRARGDRELAKWRDVVAKDLAELNRRVEREKVPAVKVPGGK